MKKINFEKRISDRLAFVVIIIAGAAIAFFTINVGEKIIDNTNKIYSLDSSENSLD